MDLTGGMVLALSLSTEKGTPKTNIASARLLENWGMEDDAHAGDWPRQISLLADESIAKIRALGLDVPPGGFAENITTRGIALLTLKIGDRLRVGESELEITQIGKECHSHCAIYQQVGDCIMPREGLFARVLVGGTLRPGDRIVIL
jgi:MOSC domain-containing protein YiiM